MSDPNGLRPLYLVDEIAKAVGQEITYVYDDLVFISHSEVLIQFAEEPATALYLYLHQELDTTKFGSTLAKYEIAAKEQAINLTYKGRFTMSPKEGSQELDLRFFPE